MAHRVEYYFMIGEDVEVLYVPENIETPWFILDHGRFYGLRKLPPEWQQQAAPSPANP